ncbi:EutN/CcmL family microcompartment protein [Caldalkalibacillus mannanilyticus]|uniref:EutN/CcmL family microcompartment protein n=1 Tax=Caldalkalibacillus mannanilyticus TaxID=1418 RepID=UPI00046A6006|nr:EutN/CcmL family microcompartment protein [Caldalkalibacillus mannanilyticus]
MRLGRITGNVWATRKEDGLTGFKFLFVQLEEPTGKGTDTQIIAVDRIGAGIGDRVMVTLGSASRFIMVDKDLPIDAVVIGIIDSIEEESR